MGSSQHTRGQASLHHCSVATLAHFEEVGAQTIAPARIEILFFHFLITSFKYRALISSLNFPSFIRSYELLDVSNSPSSSHVEPSVLYSTVYLRTYSHGLSIRACVSTPLTTTSAPKSMIMYSPTLSSAAVHAWAESNIDSACPVPGASSQKVLEYVRAVSGGLSLTQLQSSSFGIFFVSIRFSISSCCSHKIAPARIETCAFHC
mmetsp:Transcript_96556/g.176798  ORF Transcript_96556/g.176798 Transcript_96556/m.176798 type:complete len:205 (+) Transcript_96556:3-617(+)